MGGGMRQAGYTAAAGIYALDNNVQRLRQDHERARIIGEALKQLSYVHSVLPVDTNILIFKLNDDVEQEKFVKHMENSQVLIGSLDPQMIRMVTHLDIDDGMMEKTVEVLKSAF